MTFVYVSGAGTGGKAIWARVKKHTEDELLALFPSAYMAQCKLDTPVPVEIGDKPGHSFAIGKSQCTWSKLEIAGVPYKDGVSVSLDEMTGEKATTNGYHTGTLEFPGGALSRHRARE